MPTYEYECSSCGSSFEVFQPMAEDPLTDCPDCGKPVRRRINGGMGVIFKGSGFYKNDSKRSSPSKSDGAPPSCPGCSSGSCPAAASS